MLETFVVQSDSYRRDRVNRRSEFGRALGVLVIVLLSAFANNVTWAVVPAAPASSPELHLILPRGVQRGHESTLTFSGVRLNNALEILFYDKGITAKSFKVINHKSIEVVVTVDDDCRLGEHVAQVRNDRGISDFRSVFVGPFPGVAEVEPNNSFEKAQQVELNQTINGTLPAEDVDRFRLELKKDQRLSVEIEAIRLGGDFVDPVIELLGPHHADSSEAASVAFSDDRVLTNQDGFFSVMIPENGTYTIVVTEAAFQGTNQSYYRLHIGDFPRPESVFPAGGKPGATVSLTSASEHPGEFTVNVPQPDAFRNGVFVADEKGVSPSPVNFRVTELNDYYLPDDAENINFQTAVDVEVPIAINGRYRHRLQFFKFSAKKDQTWDIHGFAKQIGSGLDPVLHVFDEKKKNLIGNDDNPTRPDSTVRFKAPADGVYYLRVKDYLDRVEYGFPFRIEISPAKPSVVLAIKRNDRFSQKRQSIAVPQGGRFAAIMSVKKDFVSTGVALDHGPLPDGICMTASVMSKSVAEMPVVFDADDDAPLASSLVDISASIHDPNAKPEAQDSNATTLESRFEMPAVWSLGIPNNTPYHTCNVDRLAVGVIKRLPFSIDCVPMKAPLVRNGSAKVKVIIRRDEGFKEVIRLQFPYRPPGLGTNHQLDAGRDKTEFEYPINANGGAALGKWPFYVIAHSNVEGPAWTSSQLCELEIAEPFVKAEADRVVGGRAQKLLAKVTLEQLVAFEGTARAKLRSLPPHTQVNGPLEFDSKTESLTFEITTTDKTPFGRHGGLFVEVEIPSGGGFSTGRAGNVLLQVNKPSKKKAVEKKKPADEKKAVEKKKPEEKKPTEEKKPAEKPSETKPKPKPESKPKEAPAPKDKPVEAAEKPPAKAEEKQ